MKVLLINPSKYDANGNIERYRLGSLPPLNLLIVASLMRKCGAHVTVADEYIEDVPFDGSFDLVGLTTTFTCTFPRVIDICGRFRARGIPVVLGGTHASCVPDEACKHADAVVLREAEGKIPELLADAAAGRLKPRYGDGGLVDMENDGYELPAYDLVDLSRYIRIGMAGRANLFAVESSRGCPMGCDFCTIDFTHGKRIRCRPIGDVIREIRHLRQAYGARFFTFADDNFTCNVDRCKSLLKALESEDIRFNCELSTSILRTPDLVERLAAAGCVSALIGMESTNPENLKSVHKTFNKPSEYGELFALFRKHGISSLAAMIFGFDYDTRESIAETVRFLNAWKVPRCMFSVLTPFPGTRFYQKLDADGRLEKRNLGLYDGTHLVFKLPALSAAELEESFWAAYRAFYELPSIARRAFQAGARGAMYTAFSNLRFRKLVYQRLFPYNSGIGRIDVAN